MKLLIIADDFTGALDTGVQLSKKSIKTIVMSNPDATPILDNDCQVLVINANIRHSSPKDAYDCICHLLQLYKEEFTHIYLKTDSVLRGNISAAFKAALTTLNKPLCFIPAFPDLGRTTKDATAYVNDQLLENSVFKDDPRTPTLKSNIPEILNDSYSINCQCISSENYEKFTEISRTSDTVYIFDCETNHQLHHIGNILAQEKLYEFTAGCAGFAATFAKHLPFRKIPFGVSKSKKPVLFISGSANAVTLKQLESARRLDYTVISLSETFISNNDYNISEGKDKGVYKDLTFVNTVETAVSKLLNGESVILATATNKQELSLPENIKKSLKSEESLHNYIASYTSSLVKSILDKIEEASALHKTDSHIENLVVFGGDMVAAILEQLDCNQVTAAGEITTGVPLCQIHYQNRYRNLVTKSGGFGEPDIIPVIEQYLRN